MISQSLAIVRRRYDSDMSDKQWELIRDLTPPVLSNHTTGGRPPKYDRREVVNAILYVARTGCQWRLLPHDFPKWKTAYDYFVLWHDAGVFEKINSRLRTGIRIAGGRNPQPSAGIIDSRSVKIPANIGARVHMTLGMTIEIIKRKEVRAFHILPRRWVVERTFGWFGFYRRLAKDYERYPKHSEAFVYIAMSNIMLNRLAKGF